MSAKIITLGPANDSGYDVVSFEDAFGEFSNLKGRGRARRLARKKDKIEKRKEKKLTRINARNEVKSARQDNRLDRKSNRRTRRQEIRQAHKDNRVSGRMNRKAFKTQSRADIDAMNNPPEQEFNEGVGYDEQSYQDQSYQDQGYDDQGYDDQGYDEQSYQDEVYDEQEYGDGIGEEAGYIEDYGANFDGVMGAEDRFNEMEDNSTQHYSEFADDVATKIEWNKEMISRLKSKRASSNSNKGEASKKLIKHQNRLRELQRTLDDYANCCGEFSSADGNNASLIAQRRHEVNAARKRAIMKRRRIGQSTKVNANLNPQIGKNQIVIPSSSNAEGTGLNGLDLQDDYDAPLKREVYLGVDATKPLKVKKQISVGYVVLGVAAICVLGYLAEKKGVIKL